MKYRKIVFVVLALVVLIVGCSHETVIESHGEETSDLEASENPPNIVMFESLNDYFEFISFSNHSDEDIENYLFNSNFDMNGVKSKDDILEIQRIVETVPLPQISAYRLSHFLVDTDNERIVFFYNNTDDDWFHIKVFYGSDRDSFIQYRNEHPDEYEVAATNTKAITTLYYSPEPDEAICVFDAVVDGYLLELRAIDASREYTEELINNMTFTKIQNLG